MNNLHEVLPQDIVILLKMTTNSKTTWYSTDLSQALKISVPEISKSLERCRKAKLLDKSNQKVNITALQNYLIHTIKFAYPIQPGEFSMGIPTAFSATPIKEQFYKGAKEFVWASHRGSLKGQTVEPLYKTVPEIAKNEPELYELLVIVDTLRIGKEGEIEIAGKQLKIKFANYDKKELLS